MLSGPPSPRPLCHCLAGAGVDSQPAGIFVNSPSQRRQRNPTIPPPTLKHQRPLPIDAWTRWAPGGWASAFGRAHRPQPIRCLSPPPPGANGFLPRTALGNHASWRSVAMHACSRPPGCPLPARCAEEGAAQTGRLPALATTAGGPCCSHALTSSRRCWAETGGWRVAPITLGFPHHAGVHVGNAMRQRQVGVDGHEMGEGPRPSSYGVPGHRGLRASRKCRCSHCRNAL